MNVACLTTGHTPGKLWNHTVIRHSDGNAEHQSISECIHCHVLFVINQKDTTMSDEQVPVQAEETPVEATPVEATPAETPVETPAEAPEVTQTGFAASEPAIPEDADANV